MAGLPKIGVEAIVDGADSYLKAIKDINRANDQASESVKDTAKAFDVLTDTTDYARSVQNRYTEVLNDARAGLQATTPQVDYLKEAFAAATLAVSAAQTVFGAIGNVLTFVGNIIGDVARRAAELGAHIFNTGVDFSKIMANISAVTKKTGGDLDNLGKQLIAIGEDSVAGPMAVADAYYDVASGIQDASISMAVLNASIATAEAGQADLKATTNGLISVLNSYKGGVTEAAYFSDVFTQSVNVGKGTMNEFVAALSPIASLAASQKIAFDELGGAMAFMTQKGLTAGQAGTALQGIMTQLSRETPGVTKALRAMGESSIDSSIANHGLAGTLQLLTEGANKTGQNLQTLVGRVEAMKAVTILGTDEFKNYFKTFLEGVDEATSKAREIQRLDVSAQLSLIGARFEGIGLSISQAVLPAFSKFLQFINDAFKKIDWKKIGEGLDRVGAALGESVGKLVDQLGTMLAGIDWDQVATSVSAAFKSIADFVGGIDWGAVIAGIQGFIQTVMNVAGVVGQIFTAIGDTIIFFQAQWMAFTSSISTALFIASELITGAWDTIQAAGTSASQLFAIAMGVINQAAGTASMIVSIASAAISAAIDYVGVIAHNVGSGFSEAFASIVSAAQLTAAVIGGIMNAIGQAISSALGPAIAAINQVVSGLKQITGGGGGGGGSSTPGVTTPFNFKGSAGGGDLQEGLNIVGERGAEAIWKAGNQATVFSANQTKSLLSSNGVRVVPNTNGQSADIASMFGSLFPQASPISSSVSNIDNHSVTNNNSNVNFSFNGVQNGESALRKFSMLRATGKF